VVDSILSLSPDEVQKQRKKLIRGWANSYTFSKFIAEHLVVKYRDSLPLVICRPSIIGCSLKEPVPGWLDTMTSPGALFLMYGLGILRFLPIKSNYFVDIIPVDICANAVILAALCKADGLPLFDKSQCITPATDVSIISVNKNCIDSVPIIHISSSGSNAVTNGFVVDTTVTYFHSNKLNKQIYKPSITKCEYYSTYLAHHIFRRSIPDVIIQLTLGILPFSYGREIASKHSKMVTKLHQTCIETYTKKSLPCALGESISSNAHMY
jgi:Male sterility protein